MSHLLETARSRQQFVALLCLLALGIARPDFGISASYETPDEATLRTSNYLALPLTSESSVNEEESASEPTAVPQIASASLETTHELMPTPTATPHVLNPDTIATAEATFADNSVSLIDLGPGIPVDIVDESFNVKSQIESIAAEYGVDPGMMQKIALCESGYRADAANGPYLGIYQFNASTWSSNRNAMGLDPDPALRADPVEAIKTAAFKMSRDGYGAWPSCSKI